ncbi:2-isopropylmalate synthase LeuA [Desulfobacula toluolica]|uniref:2-isopropylmalate synthase n=1 Tax=Desulfobacula toluolica (strain DSM 7467 / Tol2) TaxID=651182 RepID=K0NIS8_DESTT|nr:2-isopropylmalate synthase LeuA [Desulfobacula toluolica]CCK78887.1 LeuA: 2-isopropylmalate synthase [Desulfobacula toluolica Tol2]
MDNKKITIIDETLREGMQYRGVMFSQKQRIKILEFQEKLNVDICQAGYPPAHDLEADAVKTLCRHAKKNDYKIRIAAMGRANLHDAAILLDTGVKDLHFHLHIKNTVTPGQLNNVLADLLTTIEFVKKKAPHAVLSIAMLDIGRSDDAIMEHCISILNLHSVDILSLPDTSGIMSPNQIFDKIHRFSAKTQNPSISVHCHNDLGMASANSVMGIIAGGQFLEASALGIGERNGIADLYTTAKTLQNQDFDINLNTNDINTFKAYYEYVDAIVYEQHNHHLLTLNTPVFGDAVKTHVAGTHAGGNFGLASEEKFFLNILCGKNLVKKYLDLHAIEYPEDMLDILTLNIKSKSTQLNRCLTLTDIKCLVASLLD